MGFKCGIVGLPNVGKSTLFNALTQTAAAEAANYPFCTIEPNIGDVGVPDPGRPHGSQNEQLSALIVSFILATKRHKKHKKYSQKKGGHILCLLCLFVAQLVN